MEPLECENGHFCQVFWAFRNPHWRRIDTSHVSDCGQCWRCMNMQETEDALVKGLVWNTIVIVIVIIIIIIIIIIVVSYGPFCCSHRMRIAASLSLSISPPFDPHLFSHSV